MITVTYDQKRCKLSSPHGTPINSSVPLFTTLHTSEVQSRDTKARPNIKNPTEPNLDIVP